MKFDLREYADRIYLQRRLQAKWKDYNQYPFSWSKRSAYKNFNLLEIISYMLHVYITYPALKSSTKYTTRP